MATLLRLADTDLQDAAMLAAGRDPANAPALAAQAVTRMVHAVATTEAGWPLRTSAGLEDIPKQNPLKPQLASMVRRWPSMAPAAPLKDGQAPPAADGSKLRDDLLAARTILEELAERFGVDLHGTGAAGNVVPTRPEPSSPHQKNATPPRVVEPAKPKSRTSAGAVPKQPKLTVVAAPPVREPKALPVPASLATIPPQKAEAPGATVSHEVEGRAAIQRPATRQGAVSSTVFWSLMDRWKVGDSEALSLIGHPGGLTKKGTRPRFKLDGKEVDALLGLQEIDTALAALELNPTSWLRKSIKEQPFSGATPLAFLPREGLPGVRAAIRFLLQSGLRMSMTT